MVSQDNSPSKLRSDTPKVPVEISSDEEEAIASDSISYQHRLGVVELHADSIRCLEDKEYIKDNIIQFYLVYLLNEVCDRAIASKVHIFDSIFFEKMEKAFDKDKVHADKRNLLTSWYDGIDIFTKDFLIFPICAHTHWFAVVVCYPWAVKPTFSPPIEGNGTSSETAVTGSSNGEDKQPCMIIMDSLRLRDRKVTLKIRDFLDFEWRTRAGTELKRFSHHDLQDYFPNLPKQKNAYDCGIYIMMYIKCFLKEPSRFYALSKKNDLPADHELRDMLEDHVRDVTRENLKTLIEKNRRQRN